MTEKKEEIKKILVLDPNVDFKELNSEEEIQAFYDMHTDLINEKYSKSVPQGLKTRTLVLETGHGFIMREPDRKILGQSFSIAFGKGEADLYGGGSWILENCWIDGDKEIKEEDLLYFNAAIKVNQVLEMRESRIKKN